MAGIAEKSLVLASILILCSAPMSAQADQLLPEIDTYLKLSSTLRVSFQAKDTREAGDPVQAEIGPSLDFYLKPLIRLKKATEFDLDDSKSRPLVFSIGYRYLPRANDVAATNRMEPVVTVNLPMKGNFLLSDRNRADLDWQNGNFTWRYRNRFQVERNLEIRSYHFSPYASVEFFYPSQYSKWSDTAIYAGCIFPIGKHVEFNPYYEHQNLTGTSPNQQLNQLRLMLKLYLSVHEDRRGPLSQARTNGGTEPMLNYPRLFFLFSFFILWLAALVGAALRRRRPLKDDEREDFSVVQTASLTLLGLIIGFSFSMAVVRYDLRKSLEEAEANAIGTEYVRTGLLPAVNAAEVQALLQKYTELRISFYRARSGSELQQIDADTAQLQTKMWSAVETPALAQPTPVMALVVSGMNDVLNSQGYTQAAWWNRIPTSAWNLMIAIALCCNVLVGYGARSAGAKAGLLFVLPLVVSIAFLLIADIDSPRGGFIHVVPQNLVSLAQSLHH